MQREISPFLRAKSRDRWLFCLCMLELLGVYIFESRPEFQTARGETATAVKLSALRSRHIHFVDDSRCALTGGAAAKLAFAHPLPAPPSMPNWTHCHPCASIFAGHWPVAGIYWAWCSTAAPRFDDIFIYCSTRRDRLRSGRAPLVSACAIPARAHAASGRRLAQGLFGHGLATPEAALHSNLTFRFSQ